MIYNYPQLFRITKTKTMSESKTKRFRIGEYAIGGIIEARVTDEDPDYEVIEVKALEWEDETKVVMSDWADTDHIKWYNQIRNTLNEMTSSYHADQIMEWITAEVKRIQTIKKSNQTI